MTVKKKKKKKKKKNNNNNKDEKYEVKYIFCFSLSAQS
jgi:hypothetical protein